MRISLLFGPAICSLTCLFVLGRRLAEAIIGGLRQEIMAKIMARALGP
jgi:hypothetical protein